MRRVLASCFVNLKFKLNNESVHKTPFQSKQLHCSHSSDAQKNSLSLSKPVHGRFEVTVTRQSTDSFSKYLNRLGGRRSFILIDVRIMYNLGNRYCSLCLFLFCLQETEAHKCPFFHAFSDTTGAIRQMIHSPGR